LAFALPSVACAPNLRDLGGIMAGDGKVVRPGILFRSEHLAPGADEAACLAALGIRAAIDLRSPRERGLAPNEWLIGQGIRIHEVDITADFRASADPLTPLIADPTEQGAFELMLATYREMPHAAGPAVKLAGALVAAGDMPLLIHCTAGKDRTGFVCAMLLLAAGVPLAAVLADYAASAGRCHDGARATTRELLHARMGVEPSIAVLDLLGGVRPEYLQASLGEIAARHASVDTYFEWLAVDRGAIAARLLL
jgi:protein-tyrosine phosphatase